MIANESAVADARTTFEALAENAIAGARSEGIWRLFAQEAKPNGSIAHEWSLPGAPPNWKQFLGQRVLDGFRKYTKRAPLKKYDKTLALDRASVEYDQDGSTAAAMDNFFNDGETFFDKLCIEALAGNPTGLDGVALLSNSHPFANGGGTWDNLTTSALSFSSFNTERARMRALLQENGEPFNLNPSILICHPDDEEIALQIAGSDTKPVSVATDGTLNSGGVGGAQIQNVFQGTFTVVTTPRFTSGDWVIIDPRYKPIGFCVWKDPMPNIVDSLASHGAVHTDQFIYQMLADANAVGLQPWAIAGKL